LQILAKDKQIIPSAKFTYLFVSKLSRTSPTIVI
jgi:hypothetical protein